MAVRRRYGKLRREAQLSARSSSKSVTPCLVLQGGRFSHQTRFGPNDLLRIDASKLFYLPRSGSGITTAVA